MTTFIHAADIHLDSPLRRLYSDESAPNADEIRGATRRALENLVNLVLSEKVPLLIIAGDLYDGDWQDFSTGLYFADQMHRLAREGVRVAVVRGNHDAANKMTKTLILPDNVKIFRSRRPETWIIDDLGMALHGQSYGTRDVTENLALNYPDPVPGMMNVGILHCLISGSEGHVSYAPCTADQLAAKAYDYWALGHVHEYTVVRETPMIIYPGCSQGRHIREPGEKGCVMVTSGHSDALADASADTVSDTSEGASLPWNNGELTVEFVPLDILRWANINVDISGCETIEQVTQAFEEVFDDTFADMDNRICCARVVLTGRGSVHGRLHTDPETLRANIRAMAARLSDQRAWIEKIELNTRPELNLEELSQSDTPQGELLRYLEELSSDGSGGGPGIYNDLELDFSQLKARLSGTGVSVPEDETAVMLESARDVILTLLSDMETSEAES